jgi:hypothetical protein
MLILQYGWLPRHFLTYIAMPYNPNTLSGRAEVPSHARRVSYDTTLRVSQRTQTYSRQQFLCRRGPKPGRMTHIGRSGCRTWHVGRCKWQHIGPASVCSRGPGEHTPPPPEIRYSLLLGNVTRNWVQLRISK